MDPANSTIPSTTVPATPPSPTEQGSGATKEAPASENITSSFGIDHPSAKIPEGQNHFHNTTAPSIEPTSAPSFFSSPSTQEVHAMQPVSTIQSIKLPENPLGKEVNFFADQSLADPTGAFSQRLVQFNTKMAPSTDPNTQPSIVLPTQPVSPQTPDLSDIYTKVQNHGAVRVYSIFLISLIVGLLILGAQSLVRALIFIFVDFPALEEAFYGHQYGETSLNQFAIGSGMLILTSAMSFFFALQYVTHFRQWRSLLFCVFGVLLIIAGIMAVILTPSLSLQSYL